MLYNGIMNKLILIGGVVWVAAALTGYVLAPEQNALADFALWVRRGALVIIVIGITMLWWNKNQ